MVTDIGAGGHGIYLWGGVVVVGAWFDEKGVVLSRECEKFEVCEEVNVVVSCEFLVVCEV